MIFALHYQVRRDRYPHRADALDQGNPFTISRLYRFRPTRCFSTVDSHIRVDQADREAGLVEVPDISRLYALLLYSRTNLVELLLNHVGIFVLGPLVVIAPGIGLLELWVSLNEVICPLVSDGRRVALFTELIGHFSHRTKSRGFSF